MIRWVLAFLALAVVAVVLIPIGEGEYDVARPAATAAPSASTAEPSPPEYAALCPAGSFNFEHVQDAESAYLPVGVVDISGSYRGEAGEDPVWRNCLIEAVKQPWTTVRLGPDVEINLTDIPTVSVAEGVNLTSVAFFDPRRIVKPPQHIAGLECESLSGMILRPGPTGSGGTTGAVATEFAVTTNPALVGPSVANPNGLEVEPDRPAPQARSPRSLGPRIYTGSHPGNLFKVMSSPDEGWCNDHVRFSGFRLHGPDFTGDSGEDSGILIDQSRDIEVSNMEIAGWGSSGVSVTDAFDHSQTANTDSVGRITAPHEIRIFGNYVHHNQHPQRLGYGVTVGAGAWARISHSVFDQNRHAIAAGGNAGGYDALFNLTLAGCCDNNCYALGLYCSATHQFDMHGTDTCGAQWAGWFLKEVGRWVLWVSTFGWVSLDAARQTSYNCGDAGTTFHVRDNAFQFSQDHAVSMRGTPRLRADFERNAFPHDEEFGDAIELKTGSKNIFAGDPALGNANRLETQSFGDYGVCDFDGDEIDDLFLATGVSWWYSSSGEFHWSYLNDQVQRRGDVRLGYFDNDKRCDVLIERNGEWLISSGGYGDWTSLGQFDAPLNDVSFGQFDPASPPTPPGVTRLDSHAFRRMADGEWYWTSVTAPDWQPLTQNSNKPMTALRYGHFDLPGDAVTDVLSVDGGRWAYSKSAREGWENLNEHLSDDMRDLLLADINHNNVDDVLKLTVSTSAGGIQIVRRMAWFVSWDGRSQWEALRPQYVFSSYRSATISNAQFAGRFGTTPGAATLVIGSDRKGHFFGWAEGAAGLSPNWQSLYPY